MDVDVSRKMQDAVQLFTATMDNVYRQAQQALEERRAVVEEQSRVCQRDMELLHASKMKITAMLEQRLRVEEGGSSAQSSWSDVIKLNIGGSHFSTSTRTLCAVPHSMLAMLVCHHLSSASHQSQNVDDKNQKMVIVNLTADCDDSGRLFIDRSPAAFPFLLDYLRFLSSGQSSLFEESILCHLSSSQRALLAADADYYGISQLVECIQVSSMRSWIERSPRFDEVSCDRSHKDLILCMLLDQQSSLVFVGSADSTVSAFQVPSLQPILHFSAHGNSYVTTMVIFRRPLLQQQEHDDGDGIHQHQSFLLTGSRDGTVAVWQIPLSGGGGGGGDDQVMPLSHRQQGGAGGGRLSATLINRFVSSDGSFVQALEICDCGSQSYSSSAATVASSSIVNSGLVLVSAHSDGSLRTWRMIDVVPPSSAAVSSSSLVSTGLLRLAATVREIVLRGTTLFAATGSMVQTVDLKSMCLVDTVLSHASPIRCLAICPERRLLCAGTWDGKLLLWDLAPRPEQQPTSTTRSTESRVGQRQSQQQLAGSAGVGAGGRLHYLGELHGCPDWVAHVVIKPPYVVASSRDLLLFFDIESSLLLRTISTGHTDTVRCFVLDQTKGSVVTGGFDATVRVSASTPHRVMWEQQQKMERDSCEEGSLQSHRSACPNCGHRMNPPAGDARSAAA